MSAKWGLSHRSQLEEQTAESGAIESEDTSEDNPPFWGNEAGKYIPFLQESFIAQLLEEAERVARALLDRLEPGEHVAVLALAPAGVILVTVNSALCPREKEWLLPPVLERQEFPEAEGLRDVKQLGPWLYSFSELFGTSNSDHRQDQHANPSPHPVPAGVR
jgi:hypothetical protein